MNKVFRSGGEDLGHYRNRIYSAAEKKFQNILVDSMVVCPACLCRLLELPVSVQFCGRATCPCEHPSHQE